MPTIPLVVELREEILAACQPDALLERSTEILLALVLNVDGEDFGTSAVDALQEIVGEVLARGRLELATRVLSALEESVESQGRGGREHVQQLPSCSSAWQPDPRGPPGWAARQHGGSEQQLALIAKYLGLVPSEAIEEFTTLLAEERDRQVRARMCQVLAKVGPPAVPPLWQGSRTRAGSWCATSCTSWARSETSPRSIRS